MFMPREGLLCERQLLPVPTSLHNLFQIHLREDEAHCVLYLRSAKQCLPPRPGRAVVCLTVPAGIKAEGLAHARQLQGPHLSARGPPTLCPLWSCGRRPWASMPGIHSGVMGGTRGPPCPVSTLESRAAPMGLHARHPLWSCGRRPWASLPRAHSGVVGTRPDGDLWPPDYYLQISKRQAQGRGSDQIPCFRRQDNIRKLFLVKKYLPIAEVKMKVLVTESYLTLCDPMDCSSPGSSVRGILQVRVLEWLSIPLLGDLPNLGIKPTSLESPAFAVRKPFNNIVAFSHS